MLFSSKISAQGTPPLTLPPEVRTRIEEALERKDFKAAEQFLVEEIARTPGSRELLVFTARLFFIDGQPLNAAIAFQKAEKISPLEEPHRFTMAMSYVALKRYDWARKELNKLAAAAPRNALYPYWLGRLDYDDQHFEAALGNFDRAITLDPNFTRSHDNRGLCLEALGREDDALGAYHKAVELNRRSGAPSPWPPHNLGSLLSKRGWLAEAEATLREALKYDPKFARARYQLGLVLEKQGSLAEAVAELERATGLDSEYAAPLYALGRIARRTGDPERAARAFAAFEELKRKQREIRTPDITAPNQEAAGQIRP
jgi:tetratricopeptide (TPR) repeat protein